MNFLLLITQTHTHFHIYTDPSIALSSTINRQQQSDDHHNDKNSDNYYDLLDDDEDADENLRESWQDFLPIATSLLEKMESCHSNLEPLVAPPD